MSKFAAWLRWLLTQEPAVAAWVSSGGLTTLLAFTFHFSRAQEAAAAVIFASAATIWTAIFAHPPEVAVATGALATLAGGLAAFGWHLSPHTTGIAAAALGVVMALFHRVNLSPSQPAVPVRPAVPPANTPA